MPNETTKLPSTVKLPAETTKILREMGPITQRLKADLAVLKQLGMGTSEIESKLDWAESARKILLERFE